MQNQFDPRPTGVNTATVGVPRAARDAGLRSYMLSVYNYMASGVLLTGIVAMLFANSGYGRAGVQGGGFAAVGDHPVAAGDRVRDELRRRTACQTSTLQLLFWALRVADGPVDVDDLPDLYRNVDRADLLRRTRPAFAGLSLYGYTTKKDLTGFGTFLIMGVVGLLVAMLINLWLQSPAMMLAISAIGVLLFAGLTAYDTQRIKSMYDQVAGTDMMGKAVIMGALSLYLDFINMFQFLLSFMGDRR